MTNGTFRIYLGAAPGVGKTFAMLNEGRRREKRGTDVVVGFVETHGRPSTAEQIGDLELVPRRRIEYKGSTFEEMDVDAILARTPRVALIDELAHTNVPGSRHAKRWEDVEELLAAGITVISTLNIQHLESVNDVVEQITGVKQQETIPDAIVRRADQVELVDMAPEAIRRRMAHGNIYPPERVDTALGNYFRPGNLAALRELALLWVADRVEEGLADYRDRHGIDRPWETRERILVAITGSEDGDRLIRRAARMAARVHGDLIAVHVASLTGEPQGSTLERQKLLVEELGGTVKEVAGDDVGETLVAVATLSNATQIVLGATRRSRYAELMRGSVINRVIRSSGTGIDVHVIGREESEAPTGPPRRRSAPALPARRIALAFALAVIGLPLLTYLITQLDAHLGLPSILLLYLLAVVVVSAVGGIWPRARNRGGGLPSRELVFHAARAHVHDLRGRQLRGVGRFPRRGCGRERVRRARLSARCRRRPCPRRERGVDQARRLLAPADPARDLAPRPGIAHGGSPSPGRIELGGGGFRRRFERRRRRSGDGTSCREPDPARRDPRARARRPGDQRCRPANPRGVRRRDHGRDRRRGPLRGGPLGQRPRRSAGCTCCAAGFDGTETPGGRRAAAARAAVEIVGTTGTGIARSGERLELLGGDLVDLGGIESGAVRVGAEDVSLPELLTEALGDSCLEQSRIRVEADPSLPKVRVDPGLLRRALLEAVGEAVDASPADAPVRVIAGAVWPGVDVRVIDRRPPDGLGDAGAVAGPGAFVAQAYVVAMRGRVEIDETPGGGTTLVMRLPTADSSDGGSRRT